MHLDTLLQVYPDARIVQTHRDPIKCMASTTSLMGTLYYMRSDQPFNAQLFDNIIMGEATAQRLEHVIEQRETGHCTGGQYCRLPLPGPDGRSHGLYRQHLRALRHGVDHARTARMQEYLRAKPKGKFGQHSYAVDKRRPATGHVQALSGLVRRTG